MVVNVSFKCDESFRKLLDRRAERHSVNASEYVRIAVVFESVTAGDVVAFKMLSEDVRAKVRDMMLKLVGDF